ncbi:uncharacterized protein [Salvelinus alpinus]|uniref:uncharacterized protein n=1 Tax=Salvelinus alpinus TaxID=8036 RepID=UPI0039FBABEC
MARCFSYGIREGASTALISGVAKPGGGHTLFITGQDAAQIRSGQDMNTADSDPLHQTLASQGTQLEQYDQDLKTLLEHIKQFSRSLSDLQGRTFAQSSQPAPSPSPLPREPFVPTPERYDGTSELLHRGDEESIRTPLSAVGKTLNDSCPSVKAPIVSLRWRSSFASLPLIAAGMWRPFRERADGACNPITTSSSSNCLPSYKSLPEPMQLARARLSPEERQRIAGPSPPRPLLDGTLVWQSQAFPLPALIARNKTSTKPTSGLLCPLPIPSHLWSHIALDFVTGLPPSNGNSVILTIIYRFSKAAHFIPLSKLRSSRETADLLVSHVFSLHGIPTDIISDRSPQFTSQVWRSFCSALGINVSLSSGYHPQINGQTERANQELETALRCATSANSSSWSAQQPWEEYAHNTLTNTSSGEGGPPENVVASGYSAYEEENEHLQEGLRVKVSALKHLSIDIGTEVKYQKNMLDDMDSDFDSTGGLLGATIGRVKQLSRGSQTKLLCYMLFFCFLVFTILYWFIKLR